MFQVESSISAERRLSEICHKMTRRFTSQYLPLLLVFVAYKANLFAVF